MPESNEPNEPDEAPDGGGEQTYTQSDVDRIVKERVAKERAKYGDLNELRRKAGEHDKLVESQKSEQQRMSDELTKAQSEAKRAQAELTRTKVGTAKGLKPSVASLLQGDSEDEITAAADALIEENPQLVAEAQQPESKPTEQQRPAERLTPVPLDKADNGGQDKTDMDAWMRNKAGQT